MTNSILYLVPLLGVVGLIVMAIKSAWVSKQDAGDENMQRLAGYIAKGAMAFLKAEWKVLSYFVVIAGILLAWSGTFTGSAEHPIHSSWVIAISFVIGAVSGSFTVFYIYIVAFKKIEKKTEFLMRNINTIIGFAITFMAVLTLLNLLYK